MRSAQGVAALLLGSVVARDAWPLQFEVSFSLQTLGFVAVALGLSVLAVRDPGLDSSRWSGSSISTSPGARSVPRPPLLLQLFTFPLVLAIWIAKPRVAWRRHRALTWLLAAYCLTVLLSTILASDPALADARVVECLKMFAIYLVVVTLTSSRVLLRRSVWTLVISGALLAGIAVLQVTTGDFFQRIRRPGAGQERAHLRERVRATHRRPARGPELLAQILLVLVPWRCPGLACRAPPHRRSAPSRALD